MQRHVDLKVHVARDADTGRWYVAASDIPGLRVEADSADELIRIIQDVAEDLIELNVDEILANDSKKARRGRSVSAQRPRMGVLPVFDTPMAVAGA